MSMSKRVGFGIAVVGLVGFTWMVAVAQSPPAASPAPKPPSTEDELRELKRRADLADQRNETLVKKNKELEKKFDTATTDFRQKLTDEKDRAIAQATQDRVPLGAMIPYIGDTLPKGYRWADGNSNWPDAPWVPEGLAGTPIPNMNGRVARGLAPQADAKNGLAQSGGHAQIPAHNTEKAGEQTLAIDKIPVKVKGHTGLISNTPPQIDAKAMRQPYFVHDNSAGWKNANWLATEGPNGTQPEGQHVHDIDLTFDVPAHSTKTGGAHEHKIPAQDYYPSYVGCRYIIRFE